MGCGALQGSVTTASDPKAQLQEQKAIDEVAFYFIHAHKLRAASSKDVGKLQDLRTKKDWVVKQTINIRSAYAGEYMTEYCTVSHRWETADEPDGEGVQLKAIQDHLIANPQIKYVWYDYYCMPQGSDRSPEDKADFKTMLREVNVLYLGTPVLILMDLSYMSRFWTSFEAFLSMQDTTADGLQPTPAWRKRSSIVCLHNAPLTLASVLKGMWQGKSPEEAAAILVKPDVLVTNQGDKDIQIEKLKRLNHRVMSLVAPEGKRQLASGEGKSASFWGDLGLKGGGQVQGQEYSRKDCFEAALTLDPKYADAWNGLAFVGGGKVAGQGYSRKDCYEAALALAGASQRYAEPSGDLPKAQQAQTGRLSNEVHLGESLALSPVGALRLSRHIPLDDTLELSPVDSLFDDIKDQPPVAFLKSIEPVEALGLIPNIKVKAETTYEYARNTLMDTPATSAQLPLEQYAAIFKYVAEDTVPSFSATLNGLCDSKENRPHLKAFVPYIWLLMHSLQNLPPYPEPKVHRGVKLNLQSQFPTGKEFHWWSFVSTTKSIKVLEQEMFCGKSGDRTIFSITLRQRQARDISPFSPLPEGEVLLPPGCRFRVVGAADMGNGLTIIDLEELPSKMYVIDLSSHVASEGQPQHQHSSAAATATSAADTPGAGNSAIFWLELGHKGGGKVAGKEYSEKECYETALSIDPKLNEAWNGLGHVGGGQVHGMHYSRAECYALYEQYQ